MPTAAADTTADRALAYLQQQGMGLLAREMTFGKTTLPLILADGAEVVFVTLSDEELPTTGGVNVLRRAIARYWAERPWVSIVRYDHVRVLPSGLTHKVGILRLSV